MKPIGQLTACVVDNGMFCAFASKLAETYKRVLYCPSWEEAFPRLTRGMVGFGMPGLEIVDSPFRFYNETDLFIFPDLNFGALQRHLHAMGKPVWGAGLGEAMETQRAEMKRRQQRLGLPTGAFETVVGTKRLREYIAKKPGGYVKISKWRGSFESFCAEDPKAVEPKIRQMEVDLGPFADLLVFIVEEPLPDRIELGMDGYTVDGQHPSHLLAGIEIKNQAYVGAFKAFEDFPEPLVRVSRALEPEFKAAQYRGNYSTEVRVGKDHEPYLIDMTCRLPSPPNELQQEFYVNLAEIVWQGANGTLVEPEPIAKFGAQIRLTSDWALKHWQPVDFPPELRQRVKLVNATVVNKQWYVIPQDCGMTEIGSVIGWGDTLEAAMDHAREAADEVKGCDLSAQTHALDDAQGEVDKCKEFGLDMF
jgi:hypothetical protein